MGFRYDIQGLRALAVLLVFVFHLNSSWLTGGFVGVDIFFVISGFLVSSIILHKKDKGTFGFADFYIGRIKRIVPVFLLMLIFVGLVGAWVYLSGDIQGLRKNMFHSAIFNSNNYLAGLDNYFGASSQENPLLHTWTLSIEMQFYFLLPLFLILVKRKYLVPLSIVIIILLFGYSFYNSTFLDNKSTMYFSLLARIPEFLIGTVFAVKAKNIKEFIGKNQNVVSIVSLIGIIVCGIFYTEYINFPGLWVILPCIFAGIILITTDSKVNALFSNKILVHIGELSYSIYLWHWAIMAFVRYYYVRVDLLWYEMIIIIISTYVLSWLSYTYVENVFRIYANKKFFFQFGVILVSLGIVIFGMPRLNNYVLPIPEVYSKPTFGLDSHSNKFVKIERYGDIVNSPNDSICLIGDSHALVYKGVIDEIGRKSNFSFLSITNDRIPPFANVSSDDFQSKVLYNQYLNLVSEFEKIRKNIKVFFISSVWTQKAPSLEQAFKDFIENLEEEQKVVILGDFPILDKNPIRINRSFKMDKCLNISVSYPEQPKFILDIVKKYPNRVFYLEFDFRRYKNLPFINDTISYYDEGHMNLYGSRNVGKDFKREFMSFVSDNRIIK